MAIKVGNSYVSEAGYAYAKQKAQAEGQSSSVMAQLSKNFPEANFSTNTSPYRGKGVNNIAVSPGILRQMETDPDKRLEYEALIYDCNSLQKTLAGKSTITGNKISAHGFIIDSNGGLSSWCITRPNNIERKSLTSLPKNDKQSWLAKILEDKDFAGDINKNETVRRA